MSFIETTKGQMPEAALEKKTGFEENDTSRSDWVEYWFQGELVHRSAHVTIKKAPAFFADAGKIG